MPWIYHPDEESFFYEPVTASALMRWLYPRPIRKGDKRPFFAKGLRESRGSRKFKGFVGLLEASSRALSYFVRLFLSKPFVSRWIGAFQRSRLSRFAVASFQKEHLRDLPTPAKNPNQFASFNAYFQRELDQSYGERPLDALAQKPSSFVSPTDARTLFFSIDQEDASTKKAPETLEAMWQFKEEYFSLSELLNISSEDFFALNRKEESRPSQIISQRLCPFDYHHIHAPLDCQVEMITPLKGPLFSVHPMAIATKAKYFFQNQRVCLRLFSEQLQLHFFLVAIGATAVGTVQLCCKEGERVKKGDKIASFACGGSSVIIAIANSPFDLVPKLLFARSRAGSGVECFTKCRDTLLQITEPPLCNY